jgi:hypothetical protein
MKEDINFTTEKWEKMRERYQEKINELDMDLTRAITLENIAKKRLDEAEQEVEKLKLRIEELKEKATLKKQKVIFIVKL